jgi:glyoxylase-like metal-dependent hydrolase (beta-lactamase superfamily II)
MKTTLIAAAVSALLAAAAAAQPVVDYAKLEVRATDFGHGVWLLGWRGGDSLVLAGPDGVLLVDASVPQMTGKITAAVAKISDRPIRFVVVTHAHADHFGGNATLAKAGATVIAHENVRKRMASGWTIAAFRQTIPPQPAEALPSITYTDTLTLHLDGETVELIHVPAAHTDTDSIVWFRTADVVHMSGAYGPGSTYPFYDLSTGGSLAGVIAAQERVLAIADDRTRIIPDEDGPENKAQLQAQHDMLVKLRSRVQALIDQGKSEDEAVAAKPTADLDAAWVPKGAFLTGDVAVRMAYQSLKGVTPPPAGR